MYLGFLFITVCVCVQGGQVDFPPAKLKSGCGEHVCYVLDQLVEKALKSKGFSWNR